MSNLNITANKELVLSSKQDLKKLESKFNDYGGNLNVLTQVVAKFISDKYNMSLPNMLNNLGLPNELKCVNPSPIIELPYIPEMSSTADTSLQHDDIASSSTNSPCPPTDLKNILIHLTESSRNLTSLKNEYNAFDEKLDKQAEKINELDQYLRLNNLLFHHMTNVPEDLNGAYFSTYFVDWVNAKFKLDGGKLHACEIDASHIQRKVEREDGSVEYVVIVRFVSRDRRNDIFYKKRQLKLSGSRVTITEQLTQDNLTLLMDAREAVGYDNAWSSQGKIYVRTGAHSKKRVKKESDLKGLKVPPPRPPKESSRQHQNTYANQVSYVPSHGQSSSGFRPSDPATSYYNSPGDYPGLNQSNNAKDGGGQQTGYQPHPGRGGRGHNRDRGRGRGRRGRGDVILSTANVRR